MTIEQTIATWVEENSEHVVATLCELIKFKSVVKSNPKDAGPGEKNCQEFLKARLENIGMFKK